MLEALGEDSQRERLGARDCFITILAVGQDTRQVGNFTDPAPIIFSLEFDRELHRTTGHSLKVIQKVASA